MNYNFVHNELYYELSINYILINIILGSTEHYDQRTN